ncbi:MAG: excinuclease ABC subunit UvrA, partial [Pseudomonadota bacterium]
TALKEGEGTVTVEPESGDAILLSEKHACPHCNISFPPLTPQLFSFNNPIGACPDCEGLGVRQYFSTDFIIPNRNLSLREGAIAPWQSKSSNYYINLYTALSKHYNFNIYTPFADLPKKIQNLILYGSGDEKIRFNFDGNDGREHAYHTPFKGVIPHLERKYRETTSDDVREWLGKFMSKRPCPTCKGSRLKPMVLNVKVGEKSIADIASLSIRDAYTFFSDLKLGVMQKTIAKKLLQEITERLKFMIDVGLDYLSLDRHSTTLAGGEDQRIRLATQIGSALTGVLYVLDEPSIGLHPRDNSKLIETLKRLRDLGNTVLVVEHDKETMLESDHIIDLGPGPGQQGGKVVAFGTPDEIMAMPQSLTGKYLSGKKSISVPKKRRKPVGTLTLKGAREHNLKNINVEIPLGTFITVSGVSGSGKSTLITDTLLPALKQRLYSSKEPAGEYRELIGWEKIDKVIDIDQSPIGRTPRSNPATYTGIFTPIRELFTQLPESRARGYKPGRFSFNVKGGRCEACEGDGTIRIEMQLMPDVYVKCEQCEGKRFNNETLELKYKGKNISEVLSMTVNQAAKFFENIPSIRSKLERMREVGLGYIELGQSATTLSGGEAQRIKLSKELAKYSTGQTLYILDEPTTGLHFDDVEKLLDVLDLLVDKGNTVIVIEHNLDVIKHADYCIDLGPEGGEKGGEIVAVGTPETLAADNRSFTGSYLKRELDNK